MELVHKYYPKTRLELIELIIERILSKGNCCGLNDIDVSAITDMSNIFNENNALRSFNGDISKWDVGNVTDMCGMFQSATFFNGDLSKWNVSNVHIMADMFNGAIYFDNDLSGWNVDKVTNYDNMFNHSPLMTQLEKQPKFAHRNIV